MSKIKELKYPKPEDFGLDQKQISFFSKTTDLNVPKELVWMFIWGYFFLCCFIFIGVLSRISDSEYLLIYFILTFVSGLIIWSVIKDFRKNLYNKRKTSDPNYPKYLEYDREYQIYLSQLRENIRIQEEENRKQIKWWNDLSGFRFEKEVTSFLRGKGYDVEHTGQCGDGGVDIIMNNDGRKIIIQCKRYKSQISPHTIRDLYGTIKSMEVDEGWVITTSRFSSGSINFSHGKPIRLLTIQNMLDIPEIKK